MSQEKILLLISFGPPPTRKYPVSYLMRKSHVSRENLMSYQFWVPIPNKKISCLLSHEKISCLKRKYYVLLVFGPLLNEKISCLLSHEIISCSKRNSHVFSVLGPPPMRKSPVSYLIRKSHVSRENLMSYQF